MTLILGPRWRIACIILQVVPPGVGAIIAGSKNPHTTYRRRGVTQLVLVVFGSWPLIIPGAVGLVWAWLDAFHIAQEATAPGPLSRPTKDADPGTLPPRNLRKEARQAARMKHKRAVAKKRAERARRDAEDDTRFTP